MNFRWAILSSTSRVVVAQRERAPDREGGDRLIYAIGGVNPWWTTPLTTVEA
jgi:hypothetical protein